MARGQNDHFARERTLFGRYMVLLGSERVHERLALAEEMLALGESETRLEAIRQALRFRAMARLTLGDIDGFHRDAASLAGFSNEFGGRFFLALDILWRTLVAILEGRFSDAENSATALLGYAADDPNFRNLYVAQLFAIRTEQGRHKELAPLVTAAAAQNPGIPAYRSAKALVCCELGEVTAAEEEFVSLASDHFAELRGTPLWPSSLSPLAEVCAALDKQEAAGELYELFCRYEGQMVVVATGTHCPGAVDRYLGMLATTAKRYDEAEHHFEAALALEERCQAPPLVARTQYWLASMLLRRAGRGDRVRAAESLASSSGASAQLHMELLAKQARQLLTQADLRHRGPHRT